MYFNLLAVQLDVQFDAKAKFKLGLYTLFCLLIGPLFFSSSCFFVVVVVVEVLRIASGKGL